jgi:undecaprenyl-diphosphatase
VALYWRRFFNPPTDREGGSWWSRIWPFYLKLVVGVLPAVVVGVTLKNIIDQNLESVQMVAVMLVVGGVFMLFCDRLFNHTSDETPLTYRRAFVIGLYQCIAALLPGTSRSMATIVGGMQQRLSRKHAAEFSFFLAVPTMFGATLKEIYDLVKDGGAEVLTAGNHLTVLILGNVVAFVVGLVAVKYFIHYITRYGFRAFGWYRIAVGLLILLLPFCGVSLKTEHEHEQAATQTTANSTTGAKKSTVFTEKSTTFAQNFPTSAS